MKDLLFCLSAVILSAAVSVGYAQPGSVRINEVMYDDTSSSDIEWVELFNTLTVNVHIGGWVLTDGGAWPPPSTEGALQIPVGTLIPPHSYLVISKLALPGIPSVICPETDALWTLDNGGDNLALYDGPGGAALLMDGSLLTVFPHLTFGNSGNSLEKCDEFAPWSGDSAQWHECTLPFSPVGRYRNCTPGMPNTPCAPLGRCCYGAGFSVNCDELTEFGCEQLSGWWAQGTDCSTNPCIPCVCPNLEVEPNNVPAAATPIPLIGNAACIGGVIEDADQLDMFSLVLPAPARVAAIVRAHDDPLSCAFQRGLNAAVGLLAQRNGQTFFLQAASEGNIGQDPRLETSFVLDPGEYVIAIGSDSNSSTTGPYMLEVILLPEAVQHLPLDIGFGDLTIELRHPNTLPPAPPDSMRLRWTPGLYAESYVVEYSPHPDSAWQGIAGTSSNSLTLPFDSAMALGFYRVLALASPIHRNHIQDYVGTVMYPPDDSLRAYPIRVDTIMITAMPDSVLQIAYFVGTFTDAIAPGFLDLTVRWDDRLGLFTDGARNVFSLDGMIMEISGVRQVIDFARVSSVSNDLTLAPLIAHEPLDVSFCVLAGIGGGSGCKDHKGWKCEPKEKNYGNGRVLDCPPPSPPFDPAPECAASACTMAGPNCVCQGTGGVGCDLSNEQRCFKAPFHNICKLHATCPETSLCRELFVGGDLQRFFDYLFFDHCECIP